MDVHVLPDAPRLEGSVVTVGVYDGVHLGHRALLDELCAKARAMRLPSAVVTFDPHPMKVLAPAVAPSMLTDLAQRLELVAACGIDHTVLVPFDRARAAQGPSEFVDEVLVGMLGAKAVVVGADFRFGSRRLGSVEVLAQLGAARGFSVEDFALVADGSGEAVTSTRIRGLLRGGDVGVAHDLLGRWHEIRGTVVAGERRGAGMGFPTANVATEAGIAMPGDGVYAGLVTREGGGDAHQAAISIGSQPTFHDVVRPVVEAYILDFSSRIYDERVRLQLMHKLRAQIRYADAADLVDQMHRDVEATREVLATMGVWPPERSAPTATRS